MNNKIKKLIKNNKFLNSIFLWILNFLCGLYYFVFLVVFRIFPIKNNKVMIVSYYGKGYGDMGKSIAQELKNIDCDIYWAVRSQYANSIPSYIIPVKYNSISYFYHLVTSKVWINNTRFELGTVKRKKQYYIQTWHGGLGLKKIEKEALDLPSTYIAQAKRDSKMIDVMISNCKYRTNQYRNNFWYNGEILEYGLPRNDIFFKNIDLKEIRKKLHVDSNDFVIMYAPTFRSYEFDYFQIDFEKIIKNYEKKYNKKVKILMRLHPNISNKYKIKNGENVLDVSSYPDAYEIMRISDLLISDYSSIFFDFLFTKKPIYLFAPDCDKYIGKRGLNFEYKKLPFSISYDSNTLGNKLINNDHKNYEKDLKNFLDEVKLLDDGKASERICDLINSIINRGGK